MTKAHKSATRRSEARSWGDHYREAAGLPGLSRASLAGWSKVLKRLRVK
jgi:hypothetical protein